MRDVFIFLLLLTFVTIGANWYFDQQANRYSGAPPYGESIQDIPSLSPWEDLRQNWERPAGPPKVGIQIGHWKNEEVPSELDNIRGNTGASAAGYKEVEVNLAIGEEAARLLREKGVMVDVLPTVIPPDYWADAFIAIHADGSPDSRVQGFKIAAPWRDLTDQANLLVTLLEESYQRETQLIKDPNITRNMRGYYAFAWWRYEHSIHPMTTAAIVETGFLTNASDRVLIVQNSDISARAIALGVLKYLESQGLLS